MSKDTNPVSIDDMNISSKLRTTLYINRILTSEQVFKYTPKELSTLYRLGKKGYSELIRCLENIGYDVSAYKEYQKQKNKTIINIYPYPDNLIYTMFGEKTVINENASKNIGLVLATLPEHYQKVIELRFKEKLTFIECEEIMKCDSCTIYKFQKSALEMLRKPQRAKFLLYKDLPFSVENKDSSSKILNLPIIKLGLDNRVEDILFGQGIETMEDLIKNIKTIKAGVKTKELLYQKMRLFGVKM